MEKVLEYGLSFVEVITFFYVMFRKSFRKIEKKNVIKAVICIVISIVGEGVDWFGLRNFLPIVPCEILFFVVLYFLFEVSRLEMFVLAIAEWTILTITEMATVVCMHSITGEILNNQAIAIVIVILCVYYGLFGRRLDRHFFRLPIRVWVLVDGILFLLTFMLEFFSLMFVEALPDSKIFRVGEILIVFGVFSICILVVALIYYFNQTDAYRFQSAYMEQQNELQKEYFLQLLSKENKTRQFRHDMIDHLLLMQNYCCKNEYNKLNAYLSDTLGEMQKISNGIYNVGNDIVNVILNHYLVPLQEKYDVVVKGFISEKLPIGQRDLCTVTANLIKNAATAVLALDKGSIVFEAKQGEKYISFCVKNHYEGAIVVDQKGIPQTCKENPSEHGIGLKNVLQIVQKYDGECKIDFGDNIFTVEVFLKI